MEYENPYRQGLYHEIFDFMMEKQVFTRADVIRYTCEELDKTADEADYAVTILLSPRHTSKIGDCRGNVACMGHLYYMEKLPRQIRCGVKDPQQFKLRWRKYPLEPRKRVKRIDDRDCEKVLNVIKKHGLESEIGEEVLRKIISKIKT